MRFIRGCVVFALLLCLRAVSRIFFRHEVSWLGPRPRSWRDVRVIAGLNHTSLYEPLYAGSIPVGLLWRIARYGVIPIADKTGKRVLVGMFFKLLANHVVAVTRQPDDTWKRVLDLIGPKSVVVLFPEGRMKRADGLDAEGKAMTVRGGIADILMAVDRGTLLIAYSGGLHHVQVPGQFLPKPFRTLRLALEPVDIPTYCEALARRAGERGFKRAVIEDLEARRDRNCPRDPEEAGVSEPPAALFESPAQPLPDGCCPPQGETAPSHRQRVAV